MLASVDSEQLDAAIPAELRGANGDWYALSQRARVVISSTERVEDPPLTYAERR